MSSELAADPDVEPGQRNGVAESSAELRDYCVLVARRYGAAQAAEDVAQDAMVAYLAAKGVVRPHAWLRTVVRRLVAQGFRDPHPFVSLEHVAGDATGPPAELVDHEVLLRQVLRGLSPRDRRVLELKLRGYSYREMAGRLGCRTHAVGTLVNRAFVRGRRVAHR